MKIQEGARPIRAKDVLEHYAKFKFRPVTMDTYIDRWYQWITMSRSKTLLGLDQFMFADFVNGTSQTFDHYWLKHRHGRCVAFLGEFQYHACVNRQHQFVYMHTPDDLQSGDSLVISLPFSDYGRPHPDWSSILCRCDDLKIPVCVDLAYWGISHDVYIDLREHTCIEHITCSLSKPFYTLENHRVGIRFSRSYNNDGISMVNEVNMQNLYSMSLGDHFMQQFDCDWIGDKFKMSQLAVCDMLGLTAANTVIFGHGGSAYDHCNRGIRNNNRVCISEFLTDQAKENSIHDN